MGLCYRWWGGAEAGVILPCLARPAVSEGLSADDSLSGGGGGRVLRKQLYACLGRFFVVMDSPSTGEAVLGEGFDACACGGSSRPDSLIMFWVDRYLCVLGVWGGGVLHSMISSIRE